MPNQKKTNSAFLKMAQAPLKPSPQLAEVLGSAAPISRPQVAKTRPGGRCESGLVSGRSWQAWINTSTS